MTIIIAREATNMLSLATCCPLQHSVPYNMQSVVLGGSLMDLTCILSIENPTCRQNSHRIHIFVRAVDQCPESFIKHPNMPLALSLPILLLSTRIQIVSIQV